MISGPLLEWLPAASRTGRYRCDRRSIWGERALPGIMVLNCTGLCKLTLASWIWPEEYWQPVQTGQDKWNTVFRCTQGQLGHYVLYLMKLSNHLQGQTHVEQWSPTLGLQMFLDYNSQKPSPSPLLARISGSWSPRTSGGRRLGTTALRYLSGRTPGVKDDGICSPRNLKIPSLVTC